MEVTEDIRTVASELLERYKDNINSSGHTASGDLANTASYDVVFDGRYFEIIFNLQSYWKFLENGRSAGKFPPIDAIERWITVKKLVPRAYSGKVPTTRQLAFLIARGISQNGTKGTKLLSDTINNSDDLIDRLVDLIEKQLEEEIEKEEI
jgi:hypothetical protein